MSLITQIKSFFSKNNQEDITTPVKTDFTGDVLSNSIISWGVWVNNTLPKTTIS